LWLLALFSTALPVFNKEYDDDDDIAECSFSADK